MKEEEIRPQTIFDEYLRLATEDEKKFFAIGERQHVECPACDQKASFTFMKNSFAYEECPNCLTLFVNPRPSEEAFSRFYVEGESSKYWVSMFYKVTDVARREKLWQPKARIIRDLVLTFSDENYKIFDIGGGYGIFAEEYEKVSGEKVIVIEPSPAFADICRSKKIKVLQAFLHEIKHEQLEHGPKAFVSFELFEHLHDPGQFLRDVYQLMEEKDLFIFTTLSSIGVDIRVLWQHSKSVYPPGHINFFNPKSIKILLEKIGFKVLTVITPGKLDIDILCNNKEHIEDRFWRAFITYASEDEKRAMQNFISESGFSSHMLILAQKTKPAVTEVR